MRISAFLAGLLLAALACRSGATTSGLPSAAAASSGPAASAEPTGSPLATALPAGQAEAIFAGGCFWCMERPFETIDGVIAVLSGYTGGDVEHPTYEQVCTGTTGHYESIRVIFDPARVTYAALLDVFFRNVDPTQSNGQFCDHGPQYRSAVFVHDATERGLAEDAARRAAATLHRDRLATRILPAQSFWVAEDYHQDYYRTHPVEYAAYRSGCGRDDRLRELWGAGASH